MKILSVLTLSSLFIFCSQFALCQNEFIDVFLVWNASFTVSQKNALKAVGFQTASQPFKNTSIELCPSTNCFKISLTTITNAENTLILSSLAAGKIQRLDRYKLNPLVYDGRRGGFVQYPPTVEHFMDMSPECGRDWSIIVISSK